MNPKDEAAWEKYQNGYASNYTQKFIDGLDCSDEMKACIAADVQAYNPGGELPVIPSNNSNGIVDGTDYNWFTWSQ